MARLKMTKISVSSCICDSNHTITGRVEGDRIIVQINTPCEKFREFDCLEFALYKLPEDRSNLIMEMEGKMGCSLNCTKECALDCTRQCLIPTAVFSVCSIENELGKKEHTESALAKASFVEATEYTSSEIQ